MTKINKMFLIVTTNFVILVLLISACTSEEMAVSSTIAFPQQEYAVGTEWHLDDGSREVVACMLALAEDELVLEDNCLWLGNPPRSLVIWPAEFSLRVAEDTVEVLNEAGEVVARAGEWVSMGGGFTPVLSDDYVWSQIPPQCRQTNNYWIACPFDMEIITGPTDTPLPPTPAIESLPQSDETTSPTDDLFDVTPLIWREITIDGITGRLIEGFPYPVMNLEPSPNGENLLLRLTVQANIGQEALLLIGVETRLAQWVNRDVFTTVPAAVWVDDGRLLAINDEGQVILIQGQDHQVLPLPVPLFTLVYGSDEIVFSTTANAVLGRLNWRTGEWQEVENPDPPQEGSLGGYWGVSQDGGYAFAFQSSGQMWRIPASWNSPAETLPTQVPPLQIVGSGMPSPPPQQVGQTPYWLISLPVILDGSLANLSESLQAPVYMVNTQDGFAVMDASTFGLSNNMVPTNYWLSPDGTALVMEITERENRQVAGLYLVETEQFEALQLGIRDGEVLGWFSDDSAVIIRENDNDAIWFYPLPQTRGERSPLAGTDDWLLDMPNGFVMIKQPSVLMLFDSTGQLIRGIDFAQLNARVLSAGVTNEYLFVSLIQCPELNSDNDDGLCSYPIFQGRNDRLFTTD
jgi:hypothetical protein